MAGCSLAVGNEKGDPYRGGDTGPPATETPEARGKMGRTWQVAMRKTTCHPDEITMVPGTTVAWASDDAVCHTLTSGKRGDAT